MNETNTKLNMQGTTVVCKPKQEGLQHDHQGKDYHLPITDVNTERRNFDGGPKEYNFVTKEDFFKEGDGPGTTDTDLHTHGKQSGQGYTGIYGGKPYPRGK